MHKTILFANFTQAHELAATGKFKVINIDPVLQFLDAEHPPASQIKYAPLCPTISMITRWKTCLNDGLMSESQPPDPKNESIANAIYREEYQDNLDELDPNEVIKDLLKFAGDKIPLVVSSEKFTEPHSHRFLAYNWLLNSISSDEYSVVNCTEDMVQYEKRKLVEKDCGSEDYDSDEQESDESEKQKVISILEEFNRYRRGQGEYEWNEDPSKNKNLSISPAEIGKAIDYAVKYMGEHQ